MSRFDLFQILRMGAAREWYGYGPYDPTPKPSAEETARMLMTLQSEWTAICIEKISGITNPMKFCGQKRCRLIVEVSDWDVKPPWGTWTSLANGPERQTFTELRKRVNEAIAPHRVFEIDFVLG